MAIGRITYANKVDYRQEGQDDKYKITAENMNEIKRVFNNSAEAIEKGLSTIDENVKKTNDARDLAKQYMEQASQDALAINGTANGIIEKVTTEDGYAQINDSSNRRLNNMIIRGNSEQIQTTGKNLLLIYKQTQTVNGITLTYDNDNKVIIANGTSTSWTNIALGVFDFKKGVTYKFVGCPKGGNVSTSYHIEPNGGLFIDIGNGATYTPSEDKLNIPLYFVVTKGVVLNNLVIKPMIATDLNVTYDDYEPYTGGQPSPNPDYPQEVKGVSEISGKIVGKNLFGGMDFANKIVEFGGVLDKENKQVSIRVNDIDDKVVYYFPNTAKNYTVIIKGSNTDKYVNMNVIYETGETVTLGTFNNGYAIYTTRSDLKPISIYGYWRSGTTIFDYEYFGVFEGILTLDDFMEYTSTSISYILSNPLYRLSDSVYDYIDVNKGKIVRNVGIYIMDGSENWNEHTLFYTNHIQYQCNLPSNIEKLFLSNKVTYLENSQINENIHKHDFFLDIGQKLNIFVPKTFVQIGNNQELKQYLQQNPITVYYQLATPTEEDIPAELLSQLKELQTYVTTTNVMFEASDVYPIVDLEYIADTKTYIDNKFKELAEVIITSTSEEEL